MKIKGCFKVSFTCNLTYLYPVGSVVYRIDKARKGILEKIGIKRIYVVGDDRLYIVMYVDTLNAIYSESDLVTYEVAVALVTDYLARLRALRDAYADGC